MSEGEAPYAEAPGNIADLNLPLGQRNLILQLHAVGKPVVLVLIQGRPLILGADIIAKASSIVYAILPGPTGGQAIAEILFGILFTVSGAIEWLMCVVC